MKPKKILCLMLCMVFLGLSACNREDPTAPFLGTWHAEELSTLGQFRPADEVSAGDWTLVIEEGGEAQLSSGGDVQTFQWSAEEEGILLEGEDDGTLLTFPCRMEEGRLVVTMLDIMDVYFVQ